MCTLHTARLTSMFTFRDTVYLCVCHKLLYQKKSEESSEEESSEEESSEEESSEEEEVKEKVF